MSESNSTNDMVDPVIEKAFARWEDWVSRSFTKMNHQYLRLIEEDQVYLDDPHERMPCVETLPLTMKLSSATEGSVEILSGRSMYARYLQPMRLFLPKYADSLSMDTDTELDVMSRVTKLLLNRYYRYSVDKRFYQNKFPEVLRNLLEIERLKVKISGNEYGSIYKLYVRAEYMNGILSSIEKPPTTDELLAH